MTPPSDFQYSDLSSVQYHAHGSISHSPSHIAMTGHEFSPEDIQDLLGGLDHQHSTDDQSDNNNNDSNNDEDALSSGVKAEESCLVERRRSLTSIASSSYGGCTGNNERGDVSSITGSSSAVAAVASGNNNTAISSEDKAQARTERKRSREKQRRSDVNKKFTELTTCLRRIESEYDAEELRVAALPTIFSPANRAELLARTVALLTVTHESNKKRKKEIADLKAELENAKKAGEETAAKLKESMMAPQNMGGNKVMMMVPMMIGGDGQHSAMPMMNPWGMNMAQTAFMPMPAAQHPNSTSNDGTNNNPNSSQSNTGSGSNSSAAPMTGQQQQQQHQMMPWMMPPHSMHMPQMPWMMPSFPTPGMAPLSHPSSNHNGKTDNSDKSTNPVGSNLAHCA